jgi:hypothetical protein
MWHRWPHPLIVRGWSTQRSLKGDHVKDLMSLWREAAFELAAWCSTSAALDYKKLECRVEAEGLSFLTIALPSYARSLEQALDAGKVDPYQFPGFKRKGGLPLFLGGFLERIFDSSGILLSVPCEDSIFAVRQLTLMFGKIQLPCSDARNAGALRKYAECEQELAASDGSIPKEYHPVFHKVVTLLYGQKFSNVDRKVFEGELWPRHGPGATADRVRGNAKFRQLVWHQRLERVFPYGEYALPSWRYKSNLDLAQFLEPGEEQPTRVVLVPKTLKTPRVIAIEPVCMQYVQQAVASALVDELDDVANGRAVKPDPRNDVVPSFVGFEQQEPNQLLALEGSLQGELATLDLSEASDRVLNSHVELLFKDWPSLREGLSASRSSKADVPGHGVIPLAKFASMGSATCFPVEAIVFSVIVFSAIFTQLKMPPTREVITSFRGKVRVYGDDIIVPVEFVGSVIRALEAFGLKVNMDKSFWTGKFRESCGADWYDGHRVTPVRVRRSLPRKRTDVEQIISVVSLRNQFYQLGMWSTAKHLDDRIRNVLRGFFPIVEETSAVLGRSSFWPYQAERTHPHLHRPIVRGYVVRSVIPKSPLTDEWALLKCLLKQGTEPFADPRHLERQFGGETHRVWYPAVLAASSRWIREPGSGYARRFS